MAVSREALVYPGDQGRGGEVVFHLAEWIGLQEDLATADAVLRFLAKERGWRFEGNIRGYWPARSLVRDRLLERIRLSIMLDSRYLETRERCYSLVRSSTRRRVLGAPKESSHQVAELDRESVRDMERLLDLVRGELNALERA